MHVCAILYLTDPDVHVAIYSASQLAAQPSNNTKPGYNVITEWDQISIYPISNSLMNIISKTTLIWRTAS